MAKIVFVVTISILPTAFASAEMFFSAKTSCAKGYFTHPLVGEPPIAITLCPTEVPVSTFTHEPQHPCVDTIITFNASASYDPNGYIISYHWEFGDGTNGAGITVEHSYAEAGYYNVRLMVTDNDELFGIALQFLNVTYRTFDVKLDCSS